MCDNTKLSRRWLLAAVLLFCLCAAAPGAAAQDTVTGAFEGTVSDVRTRARIPMALVEIINRASGITLRRRTDSQGRFYQGLLPPGVYIIRVSAPGFSTVEREQLLFTTAPNQVIPIPIVLMPESPAAPQPPGGPPPRPGPPPPAGLMENREIIAELNFTNGRRGGAFSELEVSLLPLGGTTLARTFDELALLLPGVAPPPQTLSGVAGPGVGPGVGTSGQFAVNGLRSRANNFTVDGSDNNDEDIGVRRQGFFALVPQPVESVKEYQVITLLAPAQFGRNLGGQVNAVSRSGGGGTHGAIYGFFSASQLNARDFFDTPEVASGFRLRAGGKPVLINGRPVTVTNEGGGEDSFTLGQGGLVLGGPLVPAEGGAWGKSLFYFVSAEGQLLNATKEVHFAVPTVEQRGLFNSGATGLSADPFGGGAVVGFPTTVTGDAIFSLFPFANNPGGVYGRNTLTRVLPSGGQSKALSGKADANFRALRREQSFTTRYNFTDDYRDVPAAGGALFSSLRARVRTQNLSTFLNSELSAPGSAAPAFNQARASYGRTRLVFDELRDTQFLRASELARGLGPEDGAFLLNAPRLANLTLPGFASVVYDNFFDVGVEDALGPVGQVLIAGFSPLGADVFNFPQRRVNNTYQLADMLTLQHAGHGLALGADFRRSELNSDLPRNSRPLVTFHGSPRIVTDASGAAALSGFYNPVDLAAASAPSGVLQALTRGGGSGISLRYYQHNYFAQDDWRVRRNLSLSLGLRYEYNSPPRETSRRIEETFDDPALGLVPGLNRFIAGRTRIFDPDRNNLAPRAGAAYSPALFGPQRLTVVRGGYGLFFDQALGAVVSQSRNVFPNVLTLNYAGGLPPSFGLGFTLNNPSSSFFPCGSKFIRITQPGTLNTLDPAAPLECLVELNSAFPGGFGITLPARRLEMPAAHHFSLTFEQQLAAEMVVSAAYVGTRGRHLLRLTTPNLGPHALLIPTDIAVVSGNPTVLGIALGPGQRLAPDSSPVGGRPVSRAGSVTLYESSASSRYDSLQLQWRGRLGGSFLYHLAYTFSHTTDDVSDIFDLAGAPALPQNSLTLAGERGPANFDVRHRFSYHLVYDLPDFRAGPSPLRLLLGGLRLASAGRFRTGQPFTVNSIFDVNLDGNLTDRLDSTRGVVATGEGRQPLRLTVADPTSLLAPVGQDGRVDRNTFRAGGVIELDLSLVKNLALDGGKRIELRADVFNVPNRANFGVPLRFLEAPGFGRAVETVTPARRVHFALKYAF